MNPTDFAEGRLAQSALIVQNAEQLQFALVLRRRHRDLTLVEAIERVSPAYRAQHQRRDS